MLPEASILRPMPGNMNCNELAHHPSYEPSNASFFSAVSDVAEARGRDGAGDALGRIGRLRRASAVGAVSLFVGGAASTGTGTGAGAATGAGVAGIWTGVGCWTWPPPPPPPPPRLPLEMMV
jgi:hypothetical protein